MIFVSRVIQVKEEPERVKIATELLATNLGEFLKENVSEMKADMIKVGNRIW